MQHFYLATRALDHMNTAVQTKPKLPGLISLILVSILGITLAKFMWLTVTPKNETAIQTQAISNIINAPKKKINYGKLIADHHLFGVVAVKKAPVVVTPSKQVVTEVAPTRLNLKLHGIVAYKNRKNGFALISSSGKSQKVYGKGDTIQEGVTVSAIFSDKVTLNNRGKIEELILPVKETEQAKVKKQARKVKRFPNPMGKQTLINKQQNAKEIDLGAFRQEVISTSPKKILEIMAPAPAMKNGKLIGFRIQPGRDRKLFRQLGFHPNDVVIEVNGITLNDASKGAMVLAELSQASELSVKILRGSKEIFIQHAF